MITNGYEATNANTNWCKYIYRMYRLCSFEMQSRTGESRAIEILEISRSIVLENCSIIVAPFPTQNYDSWSNCLSIMWSFIIANLCTVIINQWMVQSEIAFKVFPSFVHYKSQRKKILVHVTSLFKFDAMPLMLSKWLKLNLICRWLMSYWNWHLIPK